MRDMPAIEIRLCQTWDECVQCEELQKQVWQMPDFRDVVPASFLVTAVKNGGILVGAFDGAQMVGFAFGFMGSEGAGAARKLKHTSHMLGVLPHARKKNLGAQLKWFQRSAALAQGLALMTWTYDPLQAVNANLNLARLGAIARRYIRNAYGEMTDALNAGIASDRFEVEWFLRDERVNARAAGNLTRGAYDDTPAAFDIGWTRDGFPKIISARAPDAETWRVEIPSDINAAKMRDLALAADWRGHTRAAFERAFANGYAATDFVKINDTHGARVFYILQRDTF